MKRYLLAIFIILLSGCTTNLEPLQEYNLYTPAPIHSSYTKNQTITISMPKFLHNQNSKHIYYSYNDIEQNAYLNSQYSDLLGKMLYATIYEYIDSSGLFANVVGYSSGVDSDLRLQLIVQDISHHIRDNHSYAHMKIKALLINNQNKIIKTHQFEYKIPTTTLNAKGYIQALNIANKKFLRDLLRFIK
jgi:ABC-type uncharacterized transport system auxiliary subunit